MHRISVIIPSYNYGVYLSECIGSLLDQTLKPFEVIVVDDGSNDDTSSIVSAMDFSELTYIYQENKGASSARNNGFYHSSGDYLLFLDADDRLLPCALEKMADALSTHKNTGVVFTDYLWVNESGAVIRKESEHRNSYCGKINNRLIHECFIAPSAALIRRECLDSGEIFDEDLPCFQDWDLFYRISERWEFGYIEEALMAYRIHPGVQGIWSDSHENKIRKTRKALDHIRKKYGKKTIAPTVVNHALSGLYMEEHDYENAMITAREGLDVDGGNLYLRKRIADIDYVITHNVEATLDNYSVIISLTASNRRLYAETLLNAGKVCLENTMIDRAEVFFRRVMALDQSFILNIWNEAFLNTGIIYFDQKRYGEAGHIFDQLICDNNQGINETALIYKIKCLLEQDDIDQAETLIDKLIKAYGRINPQTCLLEAWLCQKNGKMLKALALFNKTLRRKEHATTHHAAVGVVEILIHRQASVFDYLNYLKRYSFIETIDIITLYEKAANSYSSITHETRKHIFHRVMSDLDELSDKDSANRIHFIKAILYWKTGQISKTMSVLNDLIHSKQSGIRFKAVILLLDVLMIERTLGYDGVLTFIRYLNKKEWFSEECGVRIEYRFASYSEVRDPELSFKIFETLQKRIERFAYPVDLSLITGILYHKGLILYNKGLYSEARNCFLECVDRVPDHKMAKKYLSIFRKKT